MQAKTSCPCACVDVDVAMAIVWETAEARRRTHRAHGVPRCDVGLVVRGQDLLRRGGFVVSSTSRPAPGPTRRGATSSPGDQLRCPHCDRVRTQVGPISGDAGRLFVLAGECPCRLYLLDALVAGWQYVLRNLDTLTDAPAAARRHVRARQHDHVRTARVDQGAQARTDRLAESALGRALETDEQRQLLCDIADEAGSQAYLDSENQLLERLTDLRVRRTNADSVAPESVRADLEFVRQVAARGRRVNVGSEANPELVSWWEAYIERPLGRRPRRTNVQLDAHEGAGGYLLAGASAPVAGIGGEDDDSAVVTDLLSYLRRGSAAEAKEVLRDALGTLASRHPTIRGRLLGLLSDPDAMRHLIAALRDAHEWWGAGTSFDDPGTERPARSA